MSNKDKPAIVLWTLDPEKVKDAMGFMEAQAANTRMNPVQQFVGTIMETVTRMSTEEVTKFIIEIMVLHKAQMHANDLQTKKEAAKAATAKAIQEMKEAS